MLYELSHDNVVEQVVVYSRGACGYGIGDGGRRLHDLHD